MLQLDFDKDSVTKINKQVSLLYVNANTLS